MIATTTFHPFLTGLGFGTPAILLVASKVRAFLVIN
jgi:hypothetical protein